MSHQTVGRHGTRWLHSKAFYLELTISLTKHMLRCIAPVRGMWSSYYPADTSFLAQEGDQAVLATMDIARKDLDFPCFHHLMPAVFVSYWYVLIHVYYSTTDFSYPLYNMHNAQVRTGNALMLDLTYEVFLSFCLHGRKIMFQKNSIS